MSATRDYEGRLNVVKPLALSPLTPSSLGHERDIDFTYFEIVPHSKYTSTF